MKIDKDNFNNRLSHFYTAWKNDKRSSGDTLFGGVGSIVVLMGRNEEVPSFGKSNAMSVLRLTQLCPLTQFRQIAYVSAKFPANFRPRHHWLLQYEFPATLMVFSLDSLYIVTTAKKGE